MRIANLMPVYFSVDSRMCGENFILVVGKGYKRVLLGLLSEKLEVSISVVYHRYHQSFSTEAYLQITARLTVILGNKEYIWVVVACLFLKSVHGTYSIEDIGGMMEIQVSIKAWKFCGFPKC